MPRTIAPRQEVWPRWVSLMASHTAAPSSSKYGMIKTRAKRIVSGAKAREAALPAFGDLQVFAGGTDGIALQRYAEAVGRILGAETVLLPCEGPIKPIRLFVGVGFFRQEIPVVQADPERTDEERLCGGLSLLPIDRRCRAGFRDFVIVADDFSRGTDADVKFLFLLGAEEAHVPIPDIELRRHHLVGLLEAEFAFEIGFCFVVEVESNGSAIAAHVLVHAGEEILSLAQRFAAGDVKIDGSFREGTEKSSAGRR